MNSQEYTQAVENDTTGILRRVFFEILELVRRGWFWNAKWTDVRIAILECRLSLRERTPLW